MIIKVYKSIYYFIFIIELELINRLYTIKKYINIYISIYI